MLYVIQQKHLFYDTGWLYAAAAYLCESRAIPNVVQRVRDERVTYEIAFPLSGLGAKYFQFMSDMLLQMLALSVLCIFI